MKKVLFCLIVIILTGCIPTPSRLTGGDIRLWKNTPAWELAKAVRNGDTAQIKRILTKGNISVDYREPTYGQSLLFWAVWHNQTDMVRFLLEQGANINLRDYWSAQSPIILACKYTSINVNMVSLLLDYGANPNDHASKNDFVFEGRMHSSHTPILEAANDDLIKTKILIEAGADPSYCWEPGNNALQHAATQQHYEIAEYLLIDCGVDPISSFTITIHGDTLSFRDILDRSNPNYRNTEENKASLKRIYLYLDEWEKKNKNSLSTSQVSL